MGVCACTPVCVGTGAHGLLSDTHLISLGGSSHCSLGKLLAAFSLPEFSVTERVSPSDPHGVPGNTTEGPSLIAQVRWEAPPAPAHPRCFLWSPARPLLPVDFSLRGQDPGGLGLEAASPPAYGLLSPSALPPQLSALPPPAFSMPQHRQPILFKGLYRAGSCLLAGSFLSLSQGAIPDFCPSSSPVLSHPLFIMIPN